jgi:large subunit ribosomal protein L22
MAEAAKATLRNYRISARKARLVCDLVRGKAVQPALDMLRIQNKKLAPVLSKLIRSAVANATNKATVDVDRLIISEVFVNEGPALKRWLPRAQGRATPIRKPSAHITLKLTEK